MAKPKVKVLIKKYVVAGIFQVFCDDEASQVRDILSIEGVSEVHAGGNRLTVWCNPRYDLHEVAEEVNALLNSEVPQVFKE